MVGDLLALLQFQAKSENLLVDGLWGDQQQTALHLAEKQANRADGC